jgi:hypothetical protein
VASSAGRTAAQIAEELTPEETAEIVRFLLVARAAWGADPENYRLWGALNLTLSMWLWRQLVLDRKRGLRRYVVLSPKQFERCLMAASASKSYVDWLLGRQMRERDRSPCYMRLKAIFIQRLREDSDTDKKPLLPLPAWSSR